MSGAAMVRERTFTFDAAGERLVGIVSMPAAGPIVRREGVLVVVGGPQYRVGSHRQFVLLARRLAARGIPAMRFDCAGMGDSTGVERGFADRDVDLRAAIDAFVRAVPAIDEIVIWGLCDAASAALLYAPLDARVKRLVLLNPWVRTEDGLARTHLRHYYTARLRDLGFWRQLVTGKVGVVRAAREWWSTWRRARERPAEASPATFQSRMADGWKRFAGPILLICSGDDLTAREFIDHAGRDAAWRGLLDQPRVSRCTFAEADHTFSRAEWRDLVADWTADWLTSHTTPVRGPVTRASHEAA